MDRAPSNNHMLASDLARLCNRTPAAIRAAVRDGRLRPDHVTPGRVAIFHRSNAEAYCVLLKAAEAARKAIRASFTGEKD